ncbi:hypothetical protein VE01_08258 [Pseudogymnoascus verrucosus]|uniref:Ig-like domain-containing protein n=1 Tax=Pseudogymnoascus verrucosus TaxID=342668 RepID=A0A1B8GDL0_9PEZI|nr:uncharacterized protein VE01_08258 [Pseudogymnoascus verrucosus]OBT93921.1 hypothetical protein VE01_08258 [Pseudogymnoascus verrucosus]
MKLSLLLTAAALTLAPTTTAWRVYFYQLKDGQGPSITASGPGGTGSACHSVGSLNNKISSVRWYSDNSETNPTTRCCISMYQGLGCTGTNWGQSWCRNRFADTSNFGADNQISSYQTDCYKV